MLSAGAEMDTEIRLLPGLKLTAAFQKAALVKSNLSESGYIEASDRLLLKAKFTQDYKQKIHRRLREADASR